MCLIAFALNQHKEFPLILIANRDEFYERPTKAAHKWDEEGIYAGKDLKAGGTWMGISTGGRFSAVTNYRDISNIQATAKSRGELTTDFLRSDITPNEFLNQLHKRSEAYNGFNLLTLTNHSIYHYSNYEGKINKIDEGIHGLSNAFLNSPWPKVEKIKKRFEKVIKSSFNVDDLFELLEDDTRADDQDLPRTGVPLDWERALSPICIRTENYGTCSSSILLKDKSNHVTFIEKTHSVGGRKAEKNAFEFDIK